MVRFDLRLCLAVVCIHCFANVLFLTRRAEIPNLHDRATASARHNNALLAFERDAPDRFGGLAQLPGEGALAQIPDFDAAVGAAAHNAGVVKLEGGNGVIVRGEAVDCCVSGEGPYSDGAVGTASYKSRSTHLKLAYEGGVALEYGKASSIKEEMFN